MFSPQKINRGKYYTRTRQANFSYLLVKHPQLKNNIFFLNPEKIDLFSHILIEGYSDNI